MKNSDAVKHKDIWNKLADTMNKNQKFVTRKKCSKFNIYHVEIFNHIKRCYKVQNR